MNAAEIAEGRTFPCVKRIREVAHQVACAVIDEALKVGVGCGSGVQSTLCHTVNYHHWTMCDSKCHDIHHPFHSLSLILTLTYRQTNQPLQFLIFLPPFPFPIQENMTTKITKKHLLEGIPSLVARKMYYPMYVPLVDPRKA